MPGVAGLSDPTEVAVRDRLNAEVGQRIAEVRRAAGVTQSLLARDLGIAARTVKRMESGSWGQDLYLLGRIAEIFSVPLPSLIPARLPRDP